MNIITYGLSVLVLVKVRVRLCMIYDIHSSVLVCYLRVLMMFGTSLQ